MSAPIFNIVPNVVYGFDYYVPNTLTPYQCTMCIGINDVGYGETTPYTTAGAQNVSGTDSNVGYFPYLDYTYVGLGWLANGVGVTNGVVTDISGQLITIDGQTFVSGQTYTFSGNILITNGFYNGTTPPSGGWTIYYTDSSYNLYTQVAQNTNDLLEITNYLSNNNYTNVWDAIQWYFGSTNVLGGSQILANYDLPNFVTSVNNYNNLALCFLSGYSMSFDYNFYAGELNYWVDLAQSNFCTIIGAFAISGTGAQTAIQFNGTDTYCSIAYSGNNFVPIGNDNYTISVWFNANTLNSGGLVGWGNYGTNDECNALRISTAGELINYWWNDDLTVSVELATGQWYNAVCCYDGATNTRSIYLNGTLVGSDNPIGTHAVPNADNLTIGVTNDYEYFDGLIQNVNIYNVCLTPAQILQNYYALQPICTASI